MISEEERKEVEELKSLLYRDSITQYGKRKLINLYENLIEIQNKMIELMATYIGKIDVSEDLCNDEICYEGENCNKCIIEYFRNEAKESEK